MLVHLFWVELEADASTAHNPFFPSLEQESVGEPTILGERGDQIVNGPSLDPLPQGPGSSSGQRFQHLRRLMTM